MLISPKRLNFWRFLGNNKRKRNLYSKLKWCQKSFWIRQIQAINPHYYMEHTVCVGKLTTVLEYRLIWNYRK